MSESAQFVDTYKVPVIAKLLHALPHYNITFHRINNTFRPNDEVYRESLGILASAPAALLIISLLGLLLYLMTRCCDRKPRPAHSITSLKVALSIVTVMCCAAIGLGLYGNDDLHNGLLEVLTSGRKVDNLVITVRNQTNMLESILTTKIRPQLVELADIFDQPVSNQTALSLLIVALNVVQGNVTLATNAAGDIRRPLMGISMSAFLSKGDQWELIRWPGTVAVLALLLVLCAVLLVGVARHSRCALILFSVCGLLAVTGSWLMSGLYLSSSVAVGDLCISPADYLVSASPSELPTNVLLHYTQCEPGHTNPFTQRLRESQNAINNARSAMAVVTKVSMVLFKSSGLQPKLGAVTADLNMSERILTQLTALVDCKAIHKNYLIAARGLCEGGLLGLVLMLIASFIAALLLTIMVWVDSHTWIYIRKRNDYAQVEEPSYISHQAPQNHQAMNARTLPRNHNGHFSPPAISGSHTLQHPPRKHEMMAGHPHPHQQQNMRTMGTHTLGRLPSHNHSPTHLAAYSKGPNNACSDQSGHHPQPQLYCHHMHGSHSHSHHPHQHHSAHQQQQHHQIYQQIPASMPAPAVTSGPTTSSSNAHSIYNSAASNSTANAMATMRRNTIQPNSSQGNRQPDLIDTIPNSNSIDSAMYERDKQIYRCSTLRQGGKFDSNYKPSILNCPLPEIPKEASESPKKEPSKDQSVYSKTLQRPPMKLPPNAKAIPPPKIDTPTSPPRNGVTQFNNAQPTMQKGGVISPKQKPTSPPPPSVQSPKTPNNNSTAVLSSEETSINPNDESNYAVTEL